MSTSFANVITVVETQLLCCTVVTTVTLLLHDYHGVVLVCLFYEYIHVLIITHYALYKYDISLSHIKYTIILSGVTDIL